MSNICQKAAQEKRAFILRSKNRPFDRENVQENSLRKSKQGLMLRFFFSCAACYSFTKQSLRYLLLFIAFMVCLFTHPADQRITWGFGVMALVAFLTMHFYDSLVMWLSDGNVIYIFN